MFEQITTIFSIDGILSSVSNNIDMLAGLFNEYLSGANNLRIASIILMLLAFILFLFLVIIIYVKSIMSFLRSDNTAAKKTEEIEEEMWKEEEEAELNALLDEQEREKELEKELERELEFARNEKMFQEQKEKQAQEKAKEKEEKAITEKNEAVISRKTVLNNKEPSIDLDWKKGRLKDIEDMSREINNDILSYKQSNKAIPELLGLIIDMLSRGVDDLKIAQTVMFRNQGINSEDDILQTIDSVKDFIALCVNQKFEKLPANKNLPSDEEALLHLAQGDNTYALAKLEALMDHNIEKSAAATAGVKKDELFIETSNQACTFGNLAAISDVHLATGAFELSIELAPKNVNAWSRLADMYAKAETNSKAIWAYQNVLSMADEEIYPRQAANANKMMSQHLYAQGNSLQAAKLYNSSKQFYDSLGINRRLDRQEVEIIEIIEANQQQELANTIHNILTHSSIRQYSYAQ